MRIKSQANHIRQQPPLIHRLLQTLCLFFLIMCCPATATATATDSSRSCIELHSQKHLHRHQCIASKETEAQQKSRTFLPIRGGANRPSAAMEGLKNSMASALASCCAKSLLQPFDTIKTVQQNARSDIAIGLLEAARMVMEREGGSGFLELYAGLAVSALGSVPAIGLYYGIYSYCKRILIPFFQSLYGSKSKNGKQPVVSDQALKLVAVAVSAAIGNTVASFSRVPYEVVKQKLQTGQYTNTFVAVSSMFQAQGFRAFFPMGGVAVQMLRDIPYAIFTLLAYEFMRDNWADKDHKVWKDMVAGAIAGGFGSYMTSGFDVVKTRLQTSPELYDGSVLLCAKMTFQEGGMRAFLRGSASRLLHKIPANAMFFFFFEFFRRLLLVDTASLEGKKEDGTSTKGR